MKKTMTLRELMEYRDETDVDVCDDYDESCNVALVGKYEITPYCEGKYVYVLDLKVFCTLDDEGNVTEALLEVCGTGNDENWCDLMVRMASRLLYSAAGYCDCEEYKKLFNEEA